MPITLKELRERALLSQGELAKAVGVHRLTVVAWESGRTKPHPEQRRKLVEALHCTPEELLAALASTKGGKATKEESNKGGGGLNLCLPLIS